MPQKPPNDWVDDPVWQDDTPPDTKSGFKKDWDKINTPITTKPSEWGKSVSDVITNPTLATSPTGEGGLRDFAAINTARMKGFYGGLAEGVGDFASGMSSPLNLLTLGLGASEYTAGKLGLTQIAKLLNYGTKAASAPMVIHGSAQALNPESTLSERAMGLIEAGGGGVGVLHKPPSAMQPRPKLIPKSRRLTVDAGPPNYSNRFVGGPEGTIIDLRPSEFSAEGVNPTFDAGMKQGLAPTQSTQVQPGDSIRPPVNPGLSNALRGELKTEPQTTENILRNKSVDTTLNTVEGVQAAYNSGKISQQVAIGFLQDLNAKELAARKTSKPTKSVKPTEIGEPIIPKAEIPTIKASTYIFEKEDVTPDFVAKARAQGYEFQGLNDKGDYRFSKIPGEMESTAPTSPIESKPIIPESITPVVEPTPLEVGPGPAQDTLIGRDINKPTSFAESVLPSEPFPSNQTTRIGTSEVLDLMRAGELKNVADLQKRLGVSFNQTKVIWYEAKEQLRAERAASTTSPELPIKQPGVQPIKNPTPIPPSVKTPVTPPVETSGMVVIPKAKITPEFIRNARAQGYEFDSLTETGDYKFREAPPVFETPPEPVVSKPIVSKATRTGIPVTETGNADLDGMVANLRAMRRRKGINQYNELEAMTYRGLLESIKNHPDLPPSMKAMWDEVTSPPETKISPTNPNGELRIPSPEELATTDAPKTPTRVAPKTAAQGWRDRVAELDAQNTPDSAYREILSTGSKELKSGDTWRDKVLRFAELAEKKQAEAAKPTGFGSRFKGEKGELNIDLGKKRNISVTSAEATTENVKKLYDEGYRFQGSDENGNMRFQLGETKGKAPILEEDVSPLDTTKKPEEKIGVVRQIYDLSRGIMSVDPPFVTSAAFRQAQPWVGHKNWFKAWKTAADSFSDKAWFEARQKQILESPLFKPRLSNEGKIQKSFADEIGMRMIDLKNVNSSRMEGVRTQLAERIPVYGKYISASNRAFAGFLNDLKYSQLEAFVKDGKALAKAHNDPTLDLTRNIPLAREFAEFLNDTTGSGTLKTGFGSHQYSVEMHARGLADLFFSPRLMASRVRMLNPSTYIMASPQVRKQYTYAMLRSIGAWWGIAQLGQMAGGTVVTDPNNPDFGKIKIGDTRLDPGAGFQQFIVLGSRIRPDWARLPIEPTNTGFAPLDLATGLLGTGGGKYSSSISGMSRNYGEGYNPPTRMSAIGDFLSYKIHPTAKLFFDIGAASERQPVYLLDRIMGMYVPMMTGDIVQLSEEHPELIPLVIPFSGVGGGSQTYTGAAIKPIFTPKLGLNKYDIKFGGKEE